MSRTIVTRGAALAATILLALTACVGTEDAPTDERPADAAEQGAAPDAEQDADPAAASDGGGEAAASEDAASEDASSEDADAEDAGGDTAAAAGAAVEIGTELTDEETGDVITIVSAVRNNPTEYYMASDNPDGEMIYLEVKVSAGDKFGGVISQQDFLLEDGGEEVNYASTADDEMIAAGYDYFEGTPRSDGEGAGYIPIYVEATGDTLKGAYVRPEMKILGEDATVPEFRGEFEIPAA